MLLADRESVVDEGRREAARIITEAEEERVALTSETEVVSEAQRQAARIRQEAAEEARTMRGEVDDYVDTKLANFEVVLEKTLTAVHRGRDKLQRPQHESATSRSSPAEDPDRRTPSGPSTTLTAVDHRTVDDVTGSGTVR